MLSWLKSRRHDVYVCVSLLIYHLGNDDYFYYNFRFCLTGSFPADFSRSGRVLQTSPEQKLWNRLGKIS